MTSSAHHITADIALRLQSIDATLMDAYAAYQVQQFSLQTAVKRRISLQGDVRYTNSNSNAEDNSKSILTDEDSRTPRLNLSLRLAASKANFQSYYGAMPVSEICQKLDYISATLHPLLPSLNTGAGEPDMIIDTPVAEANYAVIKRNLVAGFQNDEVQYSENSGGEPVGIVKHRSPVAVSDGNAGDSRYPSIVSTLRGIEEITQMKYNIESLVKSDLIGAHNGLTPTLADILAYDGSDPTSSDRSGGNKLKSAYDLAVENAKRTHDLRLRITNLKGGYSTLVDYVNKKMCIWDMEIEELEKMADENRKAPLTI